MPEIMIEVRGEAHTTAAPERATVHAAVSADGPDRAGVSAHVSQAVQRIRQGLQLLQDQGGLAGFVVDSLRTGAHRPWNDQGVQLPVVHTARVSVTATFTDFATLGGWVLTDDLAVQNIEWELSETTRVRLARDTRQAALRDALGRAQDYADTLGLGPVEVRSVREPGLEEPLQMLGLAMADGAAALELHPGPLDLSAQVSATFAIARA